jgi:hypothetical protein
MVAGEDITGPAFLPGTGESAGIGQQAVIVRGLQALASRMVWRASERSTSDW